MQPWIIAGRLACKPTPPTLPKRSQPRLNGRAHVQIDTHARANSSRCFLNKYNWDIRHDGYYKGETHISDRSGTFACSCPTSTDLSVICNDAIANYIYVCGTGLDAPRIVFNCFQCNLSIQSSGAGRFHRKTDDGSRPKIVPTRVHCTAHENIFHKTRYFQRHYSFSLFLSTRSSTLIINAWRITCLSRQRNTRTRLLNKLKSFRIRIQLGSKVRCRML